MVRYEQAVLVLFNDRMVQTNCRYLMITESLYPIKWDTAIPLREMLQIGHNIFAVRGYSGAFIRGQKYGFSLQKINRKSIDKSIFIVYNNYCIV